MSDDATDESGDKQKRYDKYGSILERKRDKLFTMWLECPYCRSEDVIALAGYDRDVSVLCLNCGQKQNEWGVK